MSGYILTQLIEAHKNPNLQQYFHGDDFHIQTVDALEDYAALPDNPMEVAEEVCSYMTEDDELDEIQGVLLEALEDGKKDVMKEAIGKALKMLECKQLELNRSVESAEALLSGPV